MAAAGQLLRDFTERSVLPKLEERVARLNLSITGVFKSKSFHRLAKSGMLTPKHRGHACLYVCRPDVDMLANELQSGMQSRYEGMARCQRCS
jgi:hypothetical protein